MLAWSIPAWPFGFVRAIRSVFTAILATSFTAAISIAVVLPSFFTLLVLRPATVETESTNFAARYDVILTDSLPRRVLRYVYLLCRALPMSFVLIGWPINMVFFEFQRHGRSEALTNTLVLLQLGLVLLLQSLGTVRGSVCVCVCVCVCVSAVHPDVDASQTNTPPPPK